MWSARLNEGRANETFVRSMNAIVYMMKRDGNDV